MQSQTIEHALQICDALKLLFGSGVIPQGTHDSDNDLLHVGQIQVQSGRLWKGKGKSVDHCGRLPSDMGGISNICQVVFPELHVHISKGRPGGLISRRAWLGGRCCRFGSPAFCGRLLVCTCGLLAEQHPLLNLQEPIGNAYTPTTAFTL